MRIEKIDRIAVGVVDLEKAIDFFSDLLGIKFDLPVEELESIGSRGVYSSFGLELVGALGRGPDLIERFIEKKGEGVFAVVLKVDDMEEGVRHFKEKGLRVMGEWSSGGIREVAFHPKDSYGIQIVLAEYKAPHPATCAYRHPQP